MEIITLAAAVRLYLCRLVPLARREISHWRSRAAAIEDVRVRSMALGKISGESINVVSAVFFAVLAGNNWPAAVRRIVAFQLAYELLDGITEGLPFEDGVTLHGALQEAVGGARRDHGGGAYLQGLVDTCRALTVSSPDLRRAARRIGVAQSHNHAQAGLEGWARAYAPGLEWWEAASAGISSLDVLAMLSMATDHHLVEAAYLEVCALSALLDGLVDLPGDELTGNHNWVLHYETSEQMMGRLTRLTEDAHRAVSALPQTPVHRLALAGLVAHNLAALPLRHEARRELVRSSKLVRVGEPVLRTIRGVLPG